MDLPGHPAAHFTMPLARGEDSMTEHDRTRLREVIRDVAAKVRRYQERGLGEQNTKASLIDPILEALGWDIRDPDEVHREFKPTSKDSPVDYALKLIRKPRLFIEAKGLGEVLSDRKWVAQILGYAVMAGVEWCVLTDGDEYRFYNATVAVDAEEKMFFNIRLSEAKEAEAAKSLDLISRSNMEENLLDVLWAAHFVDRRVKGRPTGDAELGGPEPHPAHPAKGPQPQPEGDFRLDSSPRHPDRVPGLAARSGAAIADEVEAAPGSQACQGESPEGQAGPPRRDPAGPHRGGGVETAGQAFAEVQGGGSEGHPPARRGRRVPGDALQHLLDGRRDRTGVDHRTADEHKRLGFLAVPRR